MREIWDKKLQEELMKLRTRLKKIIDKNRLAVIGIEEILQAEDNSPESTRKVWDYIEKKLDKAKEDKNIDDFIKWDRLHLAVTNLYVLDNLNLRKIGKHIETAYYLFLLGNTSGYLDAFEDGTKHGELIETYFHSKRSEDFQKKKRWVPFLQEREKLLEKIKVEADNYYKAGGKAFHNDLAKWFKNKPEYDEKYKSIPDDVMRKTIGMVAEKYGRKRGVMK